jgi:ZIP family zinc transporter
MNPSSIATAVLLSLVAGLGTALGGLIAVIRRPGRRSFGFLMGMTAGVMISLSFLDLVNEAWKLQGFMTATIGFGGGAFLMFALDVLLPHIHFGERETGSVEISNSECSGQSSGLASDSEGHGQKSRRRQRSIADTALFKTGVLLAIGITIHNLPEGMAVGAGYAHLPQFGIFIAAAILLHNIPEGIATALPLCTSGVSRRDAFLVSLFSGLVEPLGALIAVLFLGTFRELIPGALAFAGGVMMFITLDELIPMAREYGHQHSCAIGIIVGSIIVFLLSGALGA